MWAVQRKVSVLSSTRLRTEPVCEHAEALVAAIGLLVGEVAPVAFPVELRAKPLVFERIDLRLDVRAALGGEEVELVPGERVTGEGIAAGLELGAAPLRR